MNNTYNLTGNVGVYFSVAKNYIKNFGICDLIDNEKIELLKLDYKDIIDKFIMEKYNINLNKYFQLPLLPNAPKSFCMPEMYHSEWKMCKATKTFPQA